MEQIVFFLQVSHLLLRPGKLARVHRGGLHREGFLELGLQHGLIRLQLAHLIRQAGKPGFPIARGWFGRLGRAGRGRGRAVGGGDNPGGHLGDLGSDIFNRKVITLGFHSG